MNNRLNSRLNNRLHNRLSNRFSNRCIVLWLVGMTLCAGLQAQTIPSAVQSAAGSVMANQQFRVQASCAQSVVGPTSGMQNTVQSGFWHATLSDSHASNVRNENSDLELLPQPAQSTLRLRFTTVIKQQVTIELINLLGERLIRLDEISDAVVSTRTLDVSTIPSGTYTLRVISENWTRSQVCVIQH